MKARSIKETRKETRKEIHTGSSMDKRKVIDYVLLWQILFLIGCYLAGALLMGDNRPLFLYDLRTCFRDNLYLIKRVACLEVLNMGITCVFLLVQRKRESRIRKYWVATWFCISILAILCMLGLLLSRGDKRDAAWAEGQLVMHAFGGIDKNSYTNSYEALVTNYEAGERTFEVDLCETTDGVAVCSHLWEAENQGDFSFDNRPNLEAFLSTPICDNLTPMTFSDLCEYMVSHPDMYIITDTKENTGDEVIAQFTKLVQIAKTVDPSEEILSRVIVQLYGEDMYDWVDSVYPFSHYLLTLYLLGGPQNERALAYLCRYAVARNLDGITLDQKYEEERWIDSVFQRYQVNYFWHTVNDPEQRERLMERGATGIYTDFLNALSE